MKSKFFNHPLTKLLVAILFVGSFASVSIYTFSSSGQIWDLMIIGLRPYWKYAQIVGWLGIALELIAATLCASRIWRKAAVLSTATMVLSAIVFLARSTDFRYLTFRVVFQPLLLFIGCLALRILQLRVKSA